LPRASELFFMVYFSWFLQLRVTAKVKQIKAVGEVQG